MVYTQCWTCLTSHWGIWSLKYKCFAADSFFSLSLSSYFYYSRRPVWKLNWKQSYTTPFRYSMREPIWSHENDSVGYSKHLRIYFLLICCQRNFYPRHLWDSPDFGLAGTLSLFGRFDIVWPTGITYYEIHDQKAQLYSLFFLSLDKNIRFDFNGNS